MDYLETQKENVHRCAARLDGLVSSEGEEFKSELNKLLDQLNSCDYRLKLIVENEVGEKLLCRCTVLVPLDSEHLVTKLCQLIVHLIRKQNVSLRKEALSVLLEFLIKVIRRCPDWVHSYAFHAMSTILFENCSNAEEFWDQLVGPQGVLVQRYADKDVSRCALKCIENLTLRTSVDAYLPTEAALRCLNVLVTHLRAEKPAETDDVLHCKILVNCLCGLQNVILGARLTEIPILGEILALLKFFMFYSIAGNTKLPASLCLFPSPLSQHYFSAGASANEASTSQGSKSATQGSKSRKRHSAAKKRSGKDSGGGGSGDASFRAKNVDAWGSGDDSPTRLDANCLFRPSPWSKISSSESEHSDTEGGVTMRLRSAQSRVRQSALGTLSAVVKTLDRKIMFGYWSSFLPDAPTSMGTLASCLLKDPAPKVRSATAAVIICMLEGSKQFLSLADGREKSKTAFTTLSATLASTVQELHRSLILAVISETSTLVLTQIIKCIAVLLQVAPVHKLADGFLAKIAKHLQPLLDHRDTNVRVAALTTFGIIFGIQPPTQEVLQILQPDSISNCSWMIKACLRNADGMSADDGGKSIPLPVRLESFQVLAAATKGYFSTVKPVLSAVESTIESGLKDGEISVKLHAVKLLKELGCAMAKEIDSGPRIATGLLKDQVVKFWEGMLSTSLPSVFQDFNHPNLQVEGVDCLSTISGRIFESLPHHQQVLCQIVLLGLTVDPGNSVKAAAIRALGVFVLFPNLREDVSFVSSVAESVVLEMDNANLEVRLKTAWALGNVTDALLLNKEAGLEEVIDDFPCSLLLKLLDAALKASRDNDRIRSNGVRGLGNLLRVLDTHHCESDKFKGAIRDAINSLVKCASTGGNMKVRWNACYALGNVLHNDVLNASLADMRTDIIDTLAWLTNNCKNFKVRINAAAALRIPKERDVYGSPQALLSIWQLLVASLQNIQSSMDFTEYQHYDHLVDQICSTLCHLISLLGEDDMPNLFEMMHGSEVMEDYLARFVCRPYTTRDVADLLAEVDFAKLNLLKWKLKSWDNQDVVNSIDKIVYILESEASEFPGCKE